MAQEDSKNPQDTSSSTRDKTSQIIIRRHEKPRPRRRSMTINAFIEEYYLPHIRLCKRSWFVDEGIISRHISPTFGDKKVNKINQNDVAAWLDLLQEKKGMSQATCNRIYAVLRCIIGLAITNGFLAENKNPCAGVRYFKVTSTRERFLSWEEARNLLKELERFPHKEAAAIRLLLLTGARKGEILHARWEDVHFDERVLAVPMSKSNKPRYIALSDEALAVIDSLPHLPNSPWLFPGQNPQRPLCDLFDFWNRIRHDLNLSDVRIHDLRHTFASLLVNTGQSLYAVQKLLGHTNPKTTMRYAHLEHAALLEAVQSVGTGLSIPVKTRKKEHKKDTSKKSKTQH